MLLLPAIASAQTSAPASSRARVLQPIALTVSQDINFGSIIPSTTRNSTVRINLNDTVTPGGGAIMVGATHAASRVTGQGTRNIVILITRPGTIWLTGPGPRMRARSWTLGTTTGLTRVTGNQYRITGVGGNFGFRLGATLDVARNQAEGLYQGSYPVTVNYQ
jgi:Domain of unknown function (DUF4402)